MKIATFKLAGLHCASCKGLIEEVTREVESVEHASVDLQTSILTIEHGDGFRPELLIQNIVGLGAGYAVEQV